MSNDNIDNEINVGQVFRYIFLQSKMILFLVLFSLISSVLYYVYTDKTYKISSLIQIYTPNKQSFGQEMALDFYLGTSTISDSQSLNDLYLARSNILDIIKGNKLHLFADENNNLENIKDFIIALGNDETQSEINVSYFDENFLVKIDDEEMGYFIYDEKHITDKYELIILKPKSEELKEVSFIYVTPESIFKGLKNSFSITSTLPTQAIFAGRAGSAVLEISYFTRNASKGINVLNFANELFINKNIEAESEQARKALNFIDERVEMVREDLEREKTKLNDFRKINSTLDVDLEIQNIIKTLSALEEEINLTDIEISNANRSYTNINPIFLELQNKREVLVGQKAEINKKIKDLPSSQQNYIDLFRSIEITEQLYNELLNRRLVFSITEASTLGNFRVIDEAYLDSVVSPQLSIIPIVTFLAIILSCLIAIYRGMFFLKLSNPAEIADNGIYTNILGVVPQIDQDEYSASSDEAKIQAFESLLLNLNIEERNESGYAKIILVTSPTASNGKTFLSTEIGSRISSLNNKVLLIDNDLKRGDLRKVLNIEDKITKKEFLNLNETNIEKYKLKENLYAIPKVSGLISSFQFLFSKEYTEKFNYLKKHFDFIIMDTAPILSVSDTSMLMGLADQNILAVRHGVTKISEIKQSVKVSNQVGAPLDGLIYNCYKKSSSYYGYYGLYGNYDYQYYAKKYLYEDYKYDED